MFRVSILVVSLLLAVSAENAETLEEVCIGNAKWPEHLFSPDSSYVLEGSDPPTRPVFTGIPSSKQHHWHLVNLFDNVYHIVSVDTGEYLTAGEPVTTSVRDVTTTSFTAPPGDMREAMWTVVYLGDTAQVTSVRYDEVLYAADLYDDERRSVGTWSGAKGGCEGNSACLWTIEKC